MLAISKMEDSGAPISGYSGSPRIFFVIFEAKL